MDAQALMALAHKARQQAYAPYSGFLVGAALLCQSGRVYTGCNVENASYGGTVCAERAAAARAVGEGERVFAALAVAGGAAEDGPQQGVWPCGLCRQFLWEFAAAGMQVYVMGEGGTVQAVPLAALLPHPFGPADLAR